MRYYLSESAAMGQPLAVIEQHRKKVVFPPDWRSISMTEKRELIRDMIQYHQESDRVSYKEEYRPTWWPPLATFLNPSGSEKHSNAELDAIKERFEREKASEREQQEEQEQVELSDSFVVNDGEMEDPFIVKHMIERVWLLLHE